MFIFRKILKNKLWFLVNLMGLTLATASVIIIYSHLSRELSYDSFHSKSENIYRATLETRSTSGVSMHPARTWGDWTSSVKAEYPEIKQLTRIISYKNAVISIDKQNFYSKQTFAIDSSFFNVFDFGLISGNVQENINKPNTAFITKSIAMKYFGSIDVINKSISIMHQQQNESDKYTIAGVLKDFPENSHFHADILTSQNEKLNHNSWAYTYLLMQDNADAKALEKKIYNTWKEKSTNNANISIPHLQKLTDIHLYSNKSRELEHNGSIRSLILLAAGGIIILLIALINFFNLSRVQFISEIKTTRVKIINGATRFNIVIDKIKETLPLAFLSISIAILLVYQAQNSLYFKFNFNTSITNLLIIIALALFIILFTSVLSAILSNLTIRGSKLKSNANNYRLPLIIQLSLSIVAIGATITLDRQMNLLNNLHPSADNANMIVIAENSNSVISKYETFKEELKKYPEIEAVTAAMEKPGGNILDHFQFEMEGLDKSEDNNIKILTTDEDFFSVMDIAPIAGTTNLGTLASYKWEQDAITVSWMKQNKNYTKDQVAEYESKLPTYSDKYIINECAAKKLGYDNPKNIIGKKFKIVYNLSHLFPQGEIVAVVPNFHYTNLFNKEQPLAITCKKVFSSNFIVKFKEGKTKEALDRTSTVWNKINPNYPFRYEFITDTYESIYAGEYMQTKALSLFAIVSILLSVMGILSLSAFSIQRRTKEIGIRKISGANSYEILQLMNKSFVKWVILAFLMALPITYYAMTLWLENFAYKTALSWWIFALSGLLALIITLATISWQTWQAANRNPVDSLRYE